MFRKTRLVRQDHVFPGDFTLAGNAALAPVSSLGDSGLSNGFLSVPANTPSRPFALQRSGPPESGHNPFGKPGSAPEASSESARKPQPSDADGVPEDMATMVLNSPGFGAGSGLKPDARPETRCGRQGGAGPSKRRSHYAARGRGGRSRLQLPGAKIPPADDSLPLPDGRQPGRCRRVGTGSVFARLSCQEQLPGRGEVYHVALPDCDQPGGEPRARYQARAGGADGVSGRSRTRRPARLRIWPTMSPRRSSGCCAMSAWLRFASM